MSLKPEEYLPPELRPYYTKDEIISELIWIQEFLDEVSYTAGVNKRLAQKYVASIDKILETLKPEIFDPPKASPTDGIFNKTSR